MYLSHLCVYLLGGKFLEVVASQVLHLFCTLMLGAELARKEGAMICKSTVSTGERPVVPTLPDAVTPGLRRTEESSSLTWMWLAPAGTVPCPLPSVTPCPLLSCAPST